MLEPTISTRARDVLACVLVQLGGLALTGAAIRYMGAIAAAARCDYGDFLAVLPETSAWTINYPGRVALALLAWGHIAPLLAIPVFRRSWPPVAIQGAFTISQVLVANTLWLVLISEFPRSH